jgi:hypothetical protein
MSNEFLGRSGRERETYVKKHFRVLASGLNNIPAERLRKMRTMDSHPGNIELDFVFPSSVGEIDPLNLDVVKHVFRLFGCFLFAGRTVGYGGSQNYLSSLKSIIQVYFHTLTLDRERFLIITNRSLETIRSGMENAGMV